MKKIILTAAVLLFGMAVARTEMVDVPSANTAQGASVHYAGVYVSTQAFGVSGTGVAFSTACINTPGVFYGIYFSSGSAGAYDFVDVYDSTSADTALNRQIARVYNVNGSTASAASNIGAVSGFSGPLYPIKFFRGLITKPSVSTYNMIGTLYYKSKE